jgi:hypothetical protein
MQIRRALAAAMAFAACAAAQATVVGLSTDGSWSGFDVVDPALGLGNNDLGWIDLNDGSTLSFTFTVPTGAFGVLTVVDTGFSGDTFSVSSNGSLLGTTSSAVNSYPVAIGQADFDIALADSRYSRAVYTLDPGSYTITGALSVSALDDSLSPLNSTSGGLNVTLVPEPATALSLLAGLGALSLALRRRSR